MKNLILVRHGKSSYEGFSSDKNRKISEIGTDRTVRVALDAKEFVNDSCVFWCSAAVRAQETAAIFSEIIPFPKSCLQVVEALYTFDVSNLISIIKSAPNHIETLIVFGHNPAFTEFVNDYTNLKLSNLPTSGLVSIAFETDNWNPLKKGIVVKTLFPKDL